MAHFQFRDLGVIAYEEALQIQTDAFDQLLKAKANGTTGENRLFFCEHLPVITLGKSGEMGNLLISQSLLKDRGVSFYTTNRGGDITYHGPGQITGYPVFDLETFHLGLKEYIHRLEEVVIRFLALYNITGERMDGATGVWLDAETTHARKICAIGVKSSRYVTMHGFALNILTDLEYFSLMNPCGFKDKSVTSLAAECDQRPDFELVKQQLRALFEEAF